VGATVADGTTLDNSATVSSEGRRVGSEWNNASNTTHTTVNASADLTIAKAAPASAIAGDPAGFDYTLTVTNNGPSTHTGGVSVSDTLPTGTTFQATGSSTDCSASGQVVSCSRSVTIASGLSTVFTVHVTVGAAVANGTILDNSATVSSTGTAEGSTSNNASNTTHTTVNASADLTIAKSAPASTTAGDPAGFDYTLTVTNNGPSTHTGGVSVSDTLPTGTTFQATGSSTDCSASGQVVSCSRSVTIASGLSTVFTVHVTVGAAVANGTILDNSATVSSTGTAEGSTSNNASNTTHTTVNASADLTIAKSAPASTTAGD